jgi:hypothetical protein
MTLEQDTGAGVLLSPALYDDIDVFIDITLARIEDMPIREQIKNNVLAVADTHGWVATGTFTLKPVSYDGGMCFGADPMYWVIQREDGLMPTNPQLRELAMAVRAELKCPVDYDDFEELCEEDDDDEFDARLTQLAKTMI